MLRILNKRLLFLARGVSCCAVIVVLGQPHNATAQTTFAECIAGLRDIAVQRGVDGAMAQQVLSKVRPREQVIAADRRQPEFFEGFAEYVGRRVTSERVATGRAMYLEHRSLLQQLTEQYGVPGQYLLAFWGLESDYGRVLGGVSVFDALTTLACDARRSDYFTDELVTALRIAERGDISAVDMIGSWAGAMGQAQFMPSTYMTYAVDGDGDANIDLWGSVPDALASTAYYLAGLQWQRGLRWGREVLLPETFDYYAAGMDRGQSLGHWRVLGVADVNGNRMPALDIQASLLIPTGRVGPSFLVYENFHVIMNWNRSELFALSVGHLADRIAGGSGLTVTPPDTQQVTREQLIAIQQALNELGHDTGGPDGRFGPLTRNAIREFQHAQGSVADGFPSFELVGALGLN